MLFSCVDRPWPRHLLNLAAYAHLIPVIDGGIRAKADPHGRMLAADWKAHIAAPGRRCLRCLQQYDPAAVTMEREGMLDDPKYIAGLPADHPLRARENVFAFSMNNASLEVLQLVSMVVAPQGIADLGGQIYHAVTGELDNDTLDCQQGCPYPGELLAAGGGATALTGPSTPANDERAARTRAKKSWPVRIGRARRRIAEAVAGQAGSTTDPPPTDLRAGTVEVDKQDHIETMNQAAHPRRAGG